MKYLLVVPDKDKWSYPEKNNNKVVWSCQLPGCFFSLYDYWLCCDNGFRHGSGNPSIAGIGPFQLPPNIPSRHVTATTCTMCPPPSYNVTAAWCSFVMVLSVQDRDTSTELGTDSQAINAPLLELRRATSATSARVRRALRRAACNASGENWHPVMGWLVVFLIFLGWLWVGLWVLGFAIFCKAVNTGFWVVFWV